MKAIVVAPNHPRKQPINRRRSVESGFHDLGLENHAWEDRHLVLKPVGLQDRRPGDLPFAVIRGSVCDPSAGQKSKSKQAEHNGAHVKKQVHQTLLARER